MVVAWHFWTQTHHPVPVVVVSVVQEIEKKEAVVAVVM